MARYSWKRGKDYDGMSRLPATYSLRLNGEHLATVQQDRSTELWFWYGDTVNTAGQMRPLDVVKAEALAHFKDRR